MSGSGFRGRGFGPRGARSNGPTNGFNGPRFPHPNFNHSRPPHRLSGPEKWLDGPNFPPWQQNKNFVPRPQYRGNLQFRPKGRGRATNGRGIVRFSNPGRPPVLQFCTNFIRSLGPRTPLPQEEQTIQENKSILPAQTPLLGSEEERQQKITETADKLKQKLSSITEEDLTNFWEDDLSILPNKGSEEENIRNKGIPELRHEPPELDLTFTDFRDIGRVDCNNSKFENVEDKINNDNTSVVSENEITNRPISENDEIIILNESTEECLNILDSVQESDTLNQPDILLEDDNGQQETFHELSNSECNLGNLQLQCDNLIETEIPLNSNDTEEKLSVSNLEENITDLMSIQPINEVSDEKCLDLNDVQMTSISISVSNTQDVLQVDFSRNKNTLELKTQDTNKEIIQNIDLDTHQDDQVEANLEQIQDNLQTNVFQEETSQISMNTSDPQNNSFNVSSPNGEIESNIPCDSKSLMCLSYNEVPKLNTDKKLNTPLHFQPRVFNVPPRFAPRILGSRCRWTFQQNGKNVFFRGLQRLPFHGNRMPPPRHIAPFTPSDIVPVPFDPRAPPPFTHNIPVSSHDSQHHTLVPFSSNDLPPSFDPSEPPPNMRSVSMTESSNKQEITQSISPLDSRNQVINVPSNNMEIMQPPLAFDPRGPPPKISNVVTKTSSENLPEFNPQQPPPKIHKREETLQPPPIFDPRLSSQERSKLIAPINASGSHMMGINLTETSQMSGFNITPITPNFSQPPPINMPSHQAFLPNLPVNFQPVLPQTNTGQLMVTEFALPPPPINITTVPPPLPQEPSLENDSNHNQSVSTDDDGLEDMQEAMEFAKQIMNMTKEMKNNQSISSDISKVPLAPLEIPIPNEETTCLPLVDETNVNTMKKQKKKESKNKKDRQDIICGPDLEKQEEAEIIDDEQNVQNQDKNSEDTLLTGDQIRPKVVFNLNSKTKVIHKPEEWHRPSVYLSETKETSQQFTTQSSHKEKAHSKKHSSESKKNNINQNKKQQKDLNSKINSTYCAEVTRTFMSEKSNDIFHQDHTRDLEKLHSHCSNAITQKSQRSKKDIRKVEAPASESSWKNRVINRFLKMSKNDICNMVNNSSLRKFDIAMKHLVKERRSSLALEMRNTEDEKMKEYDREEFMNQLNAMLDPGAVVGITDLPTEFIHHLSEVLQLDPMPLELESSGERENTDINEVECISQHDTCRVYTSECSKEEVRDIQSFPEHSECENRCNERIEHKPLYNKEESVCYSLNTELNLNASRGDTSSSKKSLVNKSNPDVENTYKKQQPLFNEADLDDILLQVTERTKNPSSIISTRDESIETRKASSLTQTVTEIFDCNAFPQISTKTVADLDDIFSAGIARVKSLNKNANLDNSRIRKSSSEDRSTFRSERYERWNRKEREEPDTFRNLTKEEWEAKYGSAASASTVIRKTASNSAENLSKDDKNYHSQRYCSSDSPMRHLSLSPLTREAPVLNSEKCISHYNEFEESQRTDRSESSSDTSTNSSSDTNEETVSPNVTKLLKVIKEKEKIAKKKSLNETIRDEVAAEIEKKWKEKSKHKERKSRKREKRKRDRREKRKKEKKKKRKRNSHSDTSKSSEQSEEFRLLTEDEIKKEVVVKQEPMNTFEETILLNSGTSNNHVVPALINRTAEPTSQIESHSSQIGKQQVPVVMCDKALSQMKSKPTIISMTVQPKTKAQLKQMPESSGLGQKQIMEKSTEAMNSGNNSTSSTINIDNERMKGVTEKNKDNQVEEDNNKTINIVSLNNSLLQTSISIDNITPQINVSTNNSLPQTSTCVNNSLSQNMSLQNPLSQANISINNLPQSNMFTSNSLPEINVSVNNSLPYIDMSVNNTLPEIELSTTSCLPQTNVSTNNSLSQINLSSKIESPHTEITTTNNTINTTSLVSCVANSLSEINASNQSIIQKIATSTSSTSTETKSGYRKIDIKAYKERALQRRLKEEAKLKENLSNPVSVSQELQCTSPVNKAVNEDERVEITVKELKAVEIDASKVQIKDPRLVKIRSSKTSWEDSKKEKRERSNSEKEDQYTDIFQKNQELPVSVQSENTNEQLGFKVKDKNTTHKIDSDSNILKDSVKPTNRKNDAKSLSQEKVVKEGKMRVKAGSKIELEEKKSRKLPATLESLKFKNIRSEGSKELKLKKEKVKKSTEKKKSTKSKSMITEKQSKHSHEKIPEEGQKSLTININNTTQTDVKKISSCDIYKLDQSEKMKENMNESIMCIENIVTEHSINDEIKEKQINSQFIAKEVKKVTTDNEELKTSEHQQTVNQTTEETSDDHVAKLEEIDIEGNQNLLNSKTKKNNFKEAEENEFKNSETNAKLSEIVSTEQSNNREKNIRKEASFFEHTVSFSTEKSITEENTELIITDSHQLDQESNSLEGVYLINKENLKDTVINNNSTSHTVTNSETLNKSSTTSNMKINNAEESEVRSDSSGSPFKGFLAESIENDICQVSQLINITVSSSDVKKNEIEGPKECAEICFNDKLNVEEVHNDKSDNDSSMAIKITDRITLICTSTEEQKTTENDATDKTIHDNSDPVNDVRSDTEILETENKNIREESQTYNSDMIQENVSPVINLDSQDTFDEDGEPFIVLDEYIDDTDGKSIEKLSTLDLNIEDCITTDTDIFSNKPSQELENSMNSIKSPDFKAIEFKKLSEDFDKNNITPVKEKESNSDTINTKLSAELATHEEKEINTVSSEMDIGLNSEVAQNTKLDSFIPEISIKSSQKDILLVKDVLQVSIAPQKSYVDTEKTEPKDLPSQHDPELSETIFSEPPINSCVLIKSSLRKSLESLSLATTSTSEPKIEFSELSKETNNLEKENDKELNDSSGNKLSITPCLQEEEFIDKDTHPIVSMEQKSRESDELVEKEQKTLSKSNQRKDNETLHKIKSKSKMKHKHHKKHSVSKKLVEDTIQSEAVKIKYPSTKEAIMARMIEIDVEIHKLMTEKMTLYQMLTNDDLPTGNELQQGNTIHETKEIETIGVRPRTPSALMSQLIQNIETSPVTNQCAKTTTEIVPLKEGATNPMQSNKSKVTKHEQYSEKKSIYVPTPDSENEEATYTNDTKSATRKRKRSRWAIKWKGTSKTINNTSSEIVIEEKQANDATKSILKKVNAKQKVTEQDFLEASMNIIKSQEDFNEIFTQTDKEDSTYNNKTETFNSEINNREKTVGITASQLCFSESDKSKARRQDDENILQKDNEDTMEGLNDTDTASSVLKPPDNRTPERSSIYSDDSTWDSLLQNSSMDDQKKSTTGLALLEETYKKEIAKTRRKTEIRKKKKRKIRNLLQTVSTLTPEEEELPLSALYVKKLHQKKKFQHPLDQRTERVKDNRQVWKNVDEIINAVAENRTGDLYLEQSKVRPLDRNNQSCISDSNHTISANKEQVNGSEINSEPILENKYVIVSSTLENIEENCVEPPVDSKSTTSNDDKDNTSNDLHLISSCPSRVQNLLNNEEQVEQNVVASSESQNTKDLFESSINVEENVTKSFTQEAVEGNNVKINQIENSEQCNIETNANSICNYQDILNIPEINVDSEEVEENIDGKNHEYNLQDETVNVEENVSSDAQEMTMIPENSEEYHDNPIDPSNCEAVVATNRITTYVSNENSNIGIENENEEPCKDTLLKEEAQSEKDNVDNTSEKSSDMTKEECLISIKEHRASQRRRESERSNKSSSEENNRSRTSASSISENIETLKTEEMLGKKTPKRKRGSSRTPIRRSSRYTEEITKRIKVEVDLNSGEQEPQERNIQMQFPNISPTLLTSYDEESENALANAKRNRNIQKTVNRKRCMPPEIEILPNQPIANYELLKDVKRYKHTIPTIMNCEVRLVDSKHTILKPNVNPDVLRKYGISAINSYIYPNSVQMDQSFLVSSIQSTSAKDSLNTYMKRTLVTEFSQSQASKFVKKIDDATRSFSGQVNFIKAKREPKSMKMNLLTSEKELDTEIMPILTKEQIVVDISQDCEKPDIEIVEEKMIGTKSQQHNDSGSTLTVIETKDDKELPRTQYTVHKGPILDIKVFENSFLAASEDGRIYRYSQTSNGILNIYKGHQAAVTCLYVYNTNGIDINKEWMFSGSLDGTLRCYNITTGIQVRDTTDIGSPIQCMDEAWGIIFIGTKSGHVSRYHMKSGVIKGNSIQFSDKSVLALKATNEGPRRVLIVASRSQPITIRDAQNGLFLRTICGQKSHTVYSLMRDHNLIYCGTSSTSILVFDFTNGEQMMQYDAGVGIVCMRLHKQLLFAGCYDGNIYVFDTKDHRLVCSIPGPGNMLLSIEVIDNKIIAGSKDKRLQSWQMSRQVRTLL